MSGPLGLLDWLALLVFLLCWVGYAGLVDRVPRIRARTVIAAMDEHRHRWMRGALLRENRIADVAIIGNLMSSTSFLANTAIFILGGLLALFAAPELGRRLVATMPFASSTISDGVWEVRIGLLILIFVRAFFALTWALRTFNYSSILLGAMGHGAVESAEAQQVAMVMNNAAVHFNTGLRAYYFGLAALAWIVHPLALVAASLLVLRELYRREFRSTVRRAVQEGSGAPQP